MYKMKKGFLVLLGLICFNGVCFSKANDEIDTILNRYKHFLYLTDTSYPSPAELPVINADGRWSDIAYNDDQQGVWQVSQHLQRVRDLAMSWAKQGTGNYHSPHIKQTISLALDDWFRHRYKSKNWWHNEIGVPQIMRDIMVLMRDGLKPEERKNSIEVLGQYKLAGTGANLVWSADLGLHYGAFTGDWNLMKQCRDTIMTVIKITTEEGVQPDYSFHQHGKRLQMYHYGGAFLKDDVRIAWQLRNLSLAFPPEKIDILTQFVLNGWQWMARGIHTVPGTIDRAASRKNALHSADIRNIIPLLYEMQPESKAAFKKMYDIQQGKATLNGYRYFPYSDFTAFHQEHYSFFLKTNSTRTLLTESINEENLEGELLNSGDYYFISNGNEYFNLLPFWDWEKIPGITNFNGEKKDKIQRQNFVGNVSDGNSGLAVMDYSLEKNGQSLKTKKYWASYKNIHVMLIAGMKTKNLTEPSFTVLNQSRWQGEVTLNQPGNILQEGNHFYSHIEWLHHGDFVYLPLEKDSMNIQLLYKKARWTDINKSEPSALIDDKIFLPSIIHSPGKSATGYVVAYAPNAQQGNDIANDRNWDVLHNDSICQAVSFDKHTIMVAFYQAAKLKLTRGLKISVDKPCLLMISGDKIYISDPAHNGGCFSGKINDRKFSVCLPADGSTVLIDE